MLTLCTIHTGARAHRGIRGWPGGALFLHDHRPDTTYHAHAHVSRPRSASSTRSMQTHRLVMCRRWTISHYDEQRHPWRPRSSLSSIIQPRDAALNNNYGKQRRLKATIYHHACSTEEHHLAMESLWKLSLRWLLLAEREDAHWRLVHARVLAAVSRRLAGSLFGTASQPRGRIIRLSRHHGVDLVLGE